MADVSIETIHLSHVPPDLPVYAALYRDVKNAEFLQRQLLEGNVEFEYAFVDANMILSRQHILSAVFRALNDHQNDRLKSRNVHSEIVFSLSSNNNIGESFRRFGIQPSTTNLLIIKIGTSSLVTTDTVQQHLSQSVQGTPVPFDDGVLEQMTDLQRLRKVYKLGAGSTVKKGTVNGGRENVEAGDERKEIEVQALGLMALRGAA